MLNNLSNKYSIEEEEKYPFIPKINSRESNFYQQLYSIPQNSYNYFTDRKFFRSKSLNRLINLKNNIGNNKTTYLRNKYPKCISKFNSKNNSKSKTNFSYSFTSFKNTNYFDINDKSYPKYTNKNDINNKIRKVFPITNQNRKRINNNFFNEKKNENGVSYDTIGNHNFLDLKSIKSAKNKSPINNIKYGSKTLLNEKNINNDDYINSYNNVKNQKYKTIYPIPIPINITKISRNNDLHNYLKKKIKNQQRRNSRTMIIIPKNNGNKLEHEKKVMHSNNSSTSLYNISSVGLGGGGSLLKESLKLKSHQSPVKKEHLFSFGSDLFFIDNNNSALKLKKSNNNKANIIRRNSKSIKTGNNSLRSQKYQISTKSSGTNTYSYYNNYNFNGNKNGSEKNTNKLEMQSISEYSIIYNGSNFKDNDLLNIQTTLQTLNDSKILDLANNYISDDDSLEGYKRKVRICNNNKYI